DPLPGGGGNANEDPKENIVPAWGDPDERDQRGYDASARYRRIGHGGKGMLPSAHHAGHDQGARPGQRRDDWEKRRRMKRSTARPEDNHDAYQADRSRDPAAQPDALAEKDDRQRSDEQRRDEAGGGCFRDRKKPQAGKEEQRRTQQRHTADHLQTRQTGRQRKQRRT